MSQGFQFAIDGMKAEQFAILENNYAKDKHIEMEIGFDFKGDLKNKVIICIAKIQFFADEELFIILHFGIRFKIENESWKRLLKDDLIHVDVDIARHLAMVALGSSRGFLFSKLEGTILSNYIIPTINIQQIIKKDFDLN